MERIEEEEELVPELEDYETTDEKDKDEAIRAVQKIAQLAIQNALDEPSRSLILDFDCRDRKIHSLSSGLHSEYSHSSYHFQERAIVRGSDRVSSEEHDNGSFSAVSRDKNDLVTISSDSRLSEFSGSKRRTKKEGRRASIFTKGNLIQYGVRNFHKEASKEAWMCGVCAKSFTSFESASRHEDYHIREIVADLGWAQESLERQNSLGGMDEKKTGFETASEGVVSHDQSQPHHQQRQQKFATNEQASKTGFSPVSSRESINLENVGSPLAASRPDILTVSSRNLSHQFQLSATENHKLNENAIGSSSFEPPHEYQEAPSNHNQTGPHQIDEYVVLADEALTDVCKKAEKLALSQLEQEAEFELECYSKDKHYYDKLEEREIERRRDGTYSRFRTEGKNLAQKIQNKFVDAYAVMKQGKSKKAMSTVDHYKRKLEGDSDVQNVIENTKQTLYVNVIVKNSIQVVSHELDRLARQRWEERKQKEGSIDIRNEKGRAQFEKFKAAAQGQLVQLAGLALASDFTPRRIAVQLSNDLYRYADIQFKQLFSRKWNL